MRRVVVTGLGAVTPLGNDVRSTWEALIRGESGAGPITQFDITDFPVTFACEVKDFDPAVWIDRKQARRMDRFAQLIVAAARHLCAPGGKLVYATCSLLRAENEGVVGDMTRIRDDLVVTPNRHGTDGFFAAVLGT